MSWHSFFFFLIIVGWRLCDCAGQCKWRIWKLSRCARQKEPNVRWKLFIDFANFFNVYPVNLLLSCSALLETFISHCGIFRSKIDYILLPNYLRNKIIMSKTFDFDADNTSDHQPIIWKLDYKTQLSNDQPVFIPVRKQKVHWSKFSQEAINTI